MEISQGCFERLSLQEDGVIDFLLTSATGKFKKPRKYFKGMAITVGKSVVSLPVIVLEGLHYDMLLGVNWIAQINSKIDVIKQTIDVQGESIQFRTYQEPASNFLEKKDCVYAKVGCTIPPKSYHMVEINHGGIDKEEIVVFSTKDSL